MKSLKFIRIIIILLLIFSLFYTFYEYDNYQRQRNTMTGFYERKDYENFRDNHERYHSEMNDISLIISRFYDILIINLIIAILMLWYFYLSRNH